MNEIRATARLPNIDIEVAHRRRPGDHAEQVAVRVTARPTFNAFGPTLPALPPMLTLNPAMFWLSFWRQAFEPWFHLAAPYRTRRRDFAGAEAEAD